MKKHLQEALRKQNKLRTKPGKPIRRQEKKPAAEKPADTQAESTTQSAPAGKKGGKTS